MSEPKLGYDFKTWPQHAKWDEERKLLQEQQDSYRKNLVIIRDAKPDCCLISIFKKCFGN